MAFPSYDPFNLMDDPDEYFDFLSWNKYEFIDEWDFELGIKEYPESPYKTVKEIEAAFKREEISWNSCWEFLIRFFDHLPADAKKCVDSWEGRE